MKYFFRDPVLELHLFASQTQCPWMAAAAPTQPPGDPWSQWGGQGLQQQQWPGAGGFHSLAPGLRQIFSSIMKKMFTAAVPAPIPTCNMFSALADNIGAGGQASTVHMTLGELAVIRPSRLRRGKKGTFSKFDARHLKPDCS